MKKIKKLLLSKLFLAFASGAICALALAPFYIFIAAAISISTFFLLLEHSKSKREAIYVGFFYGFGFFLSGIYWISISLLVEAEKFAWLIPFALTLIPAALALYFVALTASYKAIIQRINSEISAVYKILIFALLWLFSELLRAYLFTGFPWNLIGYSLLFSEDLAQMASIFGIFGLSFLAVLICCIPALLFKVKWLKISFIEPTKQVKIYCAMLLATLVAGFFYGESKIAAYESFLDSDRSEKLIRIVQANIKQEMKMDADLRRENLLETIELSNSQPLNNVVAVIWSESSVPYIVNNNYILINELKKALPESGILITGALRADFADDNNYEISKIFNSLYVIDQNGVFDVYDKHHLVPFGEYVPFAKFLPFLDKVTGGSIGFSEGEGVKTIKGGDFSFSPLICYEGIFSSAVVDKFNLPDLMINVTNDAWFGSSSGPYQHFDMVKMRAIEYGIPVVRVANTGISALFDGVGRIVDKIDLNKQAIIDVKLIKGLKEPTIYSKYGFLPLILLVLFIIFYPILNLKHASYTKANRSAHRR